MPSNGGNRSGDAPSGPDVRRPNSARMYDHFLGGSANFAVDRAAAEQVTVAWPDIRRAIWANRGFLNRAVTYLCGQGVDQFLDLGSGVPTVGNVHEIAQRHNTRSRVAYVDNEPVAVAHARKLLGRSPQVSITEQDMRDPQAVLSAPGVADLLDFTRPVAVLAVSVLHFLPDSDGPSAMLAAYRDACVAGSYLTVSHGAQIVMSDAERDRFVAALARTPTPVSLRTPTEITALLHGYTFVEPGLVPVDQWHPETPVSDHEAAQTNMYGVVGHLPEIPA